MSGGERDKREEARRMEGRIIKETGQRRDEKGERGKGEGKTNN